MYVVCHPCKRGSRHVPSTRWCQRCCWNPSRPLQAPALSEATDACLEVSLTHMVSREKAGPEQECATCQRKAEVCWVGAGGKSPHCAARLRSVGPRLVSQHGEDDRKALGPFSTNSTSVPTHPCLSPVVGQMDEITGLSGYKLNGNWLNTWSPWGDRGGPQASLISSWAGFPAEQPRLLWPFLLLELRKRPSFPSAERQCSVSKRRGGALPAARGARGPGTGAPVLQASAPHTRLPCMCGPLGARAAAPGARGVPGSSSFTQKHSEAACVCQGQGSGRLGGMSVHILQHRPPRVRLPRLGPPGPSSRLYSHIWGSTAPPAWALEQSAARL